MSRVCMRGVDMTNIFHHHQFSIPLKKNKHQQKTSERTIMNALDVFSGLYFGITVVVGIVMYWVTDTLPGLWFCFIQICLTQCVAFMTWWLYRLLKYGWNLPSFIPGFVAFVSTLVFLSVKSVDLMEIVENDPNFMMLFNRYMFMRALFLIPSVLRYLFVHVLFAIYQ